MNFRRGRRREEPELNLIPLIDVLLVILIFLTITTRYGHDEGLHLDLPAVTGDPVGFAHSAPLELEVEADGALHFNGLRVAQDSLATLTQLLHQAGAGGKNPQILIRADAATRHGVVMNLLGLVRAAGFEQVTLLTRTSTALPAGPPSAPLSPPSATPAYSAPLAPSSSPLY